MSVQEVNPAYAKNPTCHVCGCVMVRQYGITGGAGQSEYWKCEACGTNDRLSLREARMACTIENRQLYCTTSDVGFGPIFESDDEGESFRTFMYRNFGDPREYDTQMLATMYAQWKDGLVAPPKEGSGR